MPFKFKCRSCKEFIYTDNLSEENYLYNCKNCEAGNWINPDFEGLIEIDKDEFSNPPSLHALPKSVISQQRKQKTLSHKYNVLKHYKDLAYLMMIVNTGWTLYSLVQINDASKVLKEYGAGGSMDNAMVTAIVTYVISMFSLFLELFSCGNPKIS